MEAKIGVPLLVSFNVGYIVGEELFQIQAVSASCDKANNQIKMMEEVGVNPTKF
ncbi:MAG TPA: hypothetical protein VK436_05995 [Methanocella sp.]|nr:hypothetical protein [Methanocella sp.]